MRPRLATLSIPILAALAACANGVKPKMSDDLPTCTTLAECRAHDGKRVHVVGVYTPFSPMPNRKLDDDSPQPVRIALPDGNGPLLEPYWHQAAARSVDEVRRHAGKRVRVTGAFHEKSPPPPDPEAATMGGACIHPVETIASAE